MHPQRRFGVTSIEHTEKLAMMLTGFTWTLCSGFEHRGFLFLNDSTRECDAQEYAVIQDGRQVESITFGWYSEAEALRDIRELMAGNFEDVGPVQPITEPAEGHTCLLCQ